MQPWWQKLVSTNIEFFAIATVDKDGGESGKVKAFQRFMSSYDKILVCTHATLRFAFEKLAVTAQEAFKSAMDILDKVKGANLLATPQHTETLEA